MEASSPHKHANFTSKGHEKAIDGTRQTDESNSNKNTHNGRCNTRGKRHRCYNESDGTNVLDDGHERPKHTAFT
ncbi:unnamed protein product [Macrosiphum euphorbiae]|uniref:Uncharacterized protein n=1 Tax=Macrosiphum euphorbiae TaxID=13131 RepID=A0AAV0YCW7_9HEMI|nr:unnamed protein product [Macrosiphum euphorbiae]